MPLKGLASTGTAVCRPSRLSSGAASWEVGRAWR